MYGNPIVAMSTYPFLGMLLKAGNAIIGHLVTMADCALLTPEKNQYLYLPFPIARVSSIHLGSIQGHVIGFLDIRTMDLCLY